MATYIPPIRNHSPHLPFGDQHDAPFYGKDILSVKQFSRGDLEYIFGVAHEMREMVAARRHLRPAQRQDPGQPVLRALHPHLLLLHRGHGAPGRQRDPDQRGALLLGLQGRVAARHRAHPGMLRRCDRAAPSGSRRGGPGGQVCPQADHQRRRRRRRAPHPGPARPVHHPGRAGPGRRADRHHAGRPEIRAHGALAGPPAVACTTCS